MPSLKRDRLLRTGVHAQPARVAIVGSDHERLPVAVRPRLELPAKRERRTLVGRKASDLEDVVRADPDTRRVGFAAIPVHRRNYGTRFPLAVSFHLCPASLPDGSHYPRGVRRAASGPLQVPQLSPRRMTEYTRAPRNRCSEGPTLDVLAVHRRCAGRQPVGELPIEHPAGILARESAHFVESGQLGV